MEIEVFYYPDAKEDEQIDCTKIPELSELFESSNIIPRVGDSIWVDNLDTNRIHEDRYCQVKVTEVCCIKNNLKTNALMVQVYCEGDR